MKQVRELDGIFFRVNRGGEWQSICFSDMTHVERLEMFNNWCKNSDEEQLCKRLEATSHHLAHVILSLFKQIRPERFESDEEYRKFLLDMTNSLADTLYDIGERYDISAVEEEE